MERKAFLRFEVNSVSFEQTVYPVLAANDKLLSNIERETLKGSPTVLITALGSWEKPVPRGLGV
jgi:hypothetical protein